MARYNTITPAGTTASTTTYSSPTSGLFTTLTGSPGYTVTLSTPGSNIGINQQFYNNTGGSVTIATPSGNIIGPAFTSATTQIIPNQAVLGFISDGTNYIVANNEGGPQQATTFTVNSTFTANGGVNLTPASANVVLSPSGTGVVTINPATKGSINNIDIGGTTAGNVTANTVTVNTSLTGSGTIDGGTF